MKRIRNILIGLLASATVVLMSQGENLQKCYAKEVVRFHVLANSDSEADQALKLQVRDRVGAYVSDLLKSVESRDETLGVIQEHLTDIESVAQQEILRQGYTYGVRASLETTEFPVKEYGKYHMPAGDYTALRVQIGEAKGQNWWCVMYPNMCFAGSTYEIVEHEEKQQMYEVFTLYEYEKLIESPKKEIRFKYL